MKKADITYERENTSHKLDEIVQQIPPPILPPACASQSSVRPTPPPAYAAQPFNNALRPPLFSPNPINNALMPLFNAAQSLIRLSQQQFAAPQPSLSMLQTPFIKREVLSPDLEEIGQETKPFLLPPHCALQLSSPQLTNHKPSIQDSQAFIQAEETSVQHLPTHSYNLRPRQTKGKKLNKRKASIPKRRVTRKEKGAIIWERIQHYNPPLPKNSIPQQGVVKQEKNEGNYGERIQHYNPPLPKNSIPQQGVVKQEINEGNFGERIQYHNQPFPYSSTQNIPHPPQYNLYNTSQDQIGIRTNPYTYTMERPTNRQRVGDSLNNHEHNIHHQSIPEYPRRMSHQWNTETRPQIQFIDHQNPQGNLFSSNTMYDNQMLTQPMQQINTLPTPNYHPSMHGSWEQIFHSQIKQETQTRVDDSCSYNWPGTNYPISKQWLEAMVKHYGNQKVQAWLIHLEKIPQAPSSHGTHMRNFDQQNRRVQPQTLYSSTFSNHEEANLHHLPTYENQMIAPTVQLIKLEEGYNHHQSPIHENQIIEPSYELMNQERNHNYCMPIYQAPNQCFNREEMNNHHDWPVHVPPNQSMIQEGGSTYHRPIHGNQMVGPQHRLLIPESWNFHHY